MFNQRKCLICKRPRDTLYWHKDEMSIWVYCSGICARIYSLYEYQTVANVHIKDIDLKSIEFEDALPSEVNTMEWPRNFHPITDSTSIDGMNYIKNVRKLSPTSNMFYCVDRKAIVLPYFFEHEFVGAQFRYVNKFIDSSGAERKIDTMPGTRLSLLFYNWDQNALMKNVKGVILTEGAFDAIAIQEASNKMYGSAFHNPWKVVATSGSNASAHKLETTKDLIKKGYKVVLAPDSDEAGVKMGSKFVDNYACTHLAYTGERGVDWNDMWINHRCDPERFMKYFLGKIDVI